MCLGGWAWTVLWVVVFGLGGFWLVGLSVGFGLVDLAGCDLVADCPVGVCGFRLGLFRSLFLLVGVAFCVWWVICVGVFVVAWGLVCVGLLVAGLRGLPVLFV